MLFSSCLHVSSSLVLMCVERRIKVTLQVHSRTVTEMLCFFFFSSTRHLLVEMLCCQCVGALLTWRSSPTRRCHLKPKWLSASPTCCRWCQWCSRGEEPNPATCRYLLAVDLLSTVAIVIYRGLWGGVIYMMDSC